MAARFQTVRRRSRFKVQGFSPDAMMRISEATRASVLARIQRGQTVQDSPARPLSMKYQEKWNEHKLQKLGADRGYRAQKMRKGGKPIRDWTLTGHTLRCMKTLWVAVNRAGIGFLNSFLPNRKLSAAQIAAINNRRDRQFGVSQKDRQALQEAVHKELRGFVKIESEVA